MERRGVSDRRQSRNRRSSREASQTRRPQAPPGIADTEGATERNSSGTSRSFPTRGEGIPGSRRLARCTRRTRRSWPSQMHRQKPRCDRTAPEPDPVVAAKLHQPCCTSMAVSEPNAREDAGISPASFRTAALLDDLRRTAARATAKEHGETLRASWANICRNANTQALSPLPPRPRARSQRRVIAARLHHRASQRILGCCRCLGRHCLAPPSLTVADPFGPAAFLAQARPQAILQAERLAQADPRLAHPWADSRRPPWHSDREQPRLRSANHPRQRECPNWPRSGSAGSK